MEDYFIPKGMLPFWKLLRSVWDEGSWNTGFPCPSMDVCLEFASTKAFLAPMLSEFSALEPPAALSVPSLCTSSGGGGGHSSSKWLRFPCMLEGSVFLLPTLYRRQKGSLGQWDGLAGVLISTIVFYHLLNKVQCCVFAGCCVFSALIVFFFGLAT